MYICVHLIQNVSNIQQLSVIQAIAGVRRFCCHNLTEYPILGNQECPPPEMQLLMEDLGAGVWRLIAVSPKDTISFRM